MRTDYDVVEYPHRPFSQTSPDRLAVLGMLFGMEPALPSKCRVLELGCGSGGNLIPLADLNPGSSYLGLDLAQTPIDAGRKRIESLGLQNIRLEQMNVMDFPESEGEFDYIILHGLFSWVPEPVRLRILEICRKHLSPNGMAYISYNAYPGGHIRQAWRDIMLFHTRQFQDPKVKVQQARGMLGLVAHGTTRTDAAHQLAKEDHEKRLDVGDAAIFHDDLAECWQPFYFHEFASLAAAHGLQYVGEANYPDMLPSGLTPEGEAAMHAVEKAGIVMFEQYLDFLKLRRFRQTVVCREGVELRRPADLAAVERMFVSAPIRQVEVEDKNAPPGAVAFQNAINEVTVTSTNSVTVAALNAIAAAWPSTVSFDDLVQVCGGNRVALREILHTLYGASLLGLHAVPRKGANVAGDKPLVWRVARLEASIDIALPHLYHGSIELTDQEVRKLILLCDGEHTKAELAAAVPSLDLEENLHKIARAGLLLA